MELLFARRGFLSSGWKAGDFKGVVRELLREILSARVDHEIFALL